MKKISSLFMMGLFASCSTMAQETVYFSNLDQSATSTSPVASDSWLAEVFGTGSNPGGYLLDSVQLAIADATGNPNGFTVMIYSRVFEPFGYVPGSSLGTLQGPLNPDTAGIYTYTPLNNLILSPNTGYYIVLTSDTPSSQGTYYWNRIAYSFGPGVAGGYGGWGAGEVFNSSNGTTGWTIFSDEGSAQFSITAELAPEPSTAALVVLGGGILFYAHKRRRFRL